MARTVLIPSALVFFISFTFFFGPTLVLFRVGYVQSLESYVEGGGGDY